MRSERITTARPVRAPTRLSPGVLEEALVRHVGQHSYDLWFTPYARICPSTDEVIIAVPTQQLRDWLSKKFNKEINAAIRDTVGKSIPVRFEIDPEQFRPNQTKPHPARSGSGASRASSSPPRCRRTPVCRTAGQAAVRLADRRRHQAPLWQDRNAPLAATG